MHLACRRFTRWWVLFCPWNRGKIAYFEACPVATPEMAAFSKLFGSCVYLFFYFYLRWFVADSQPNRTVHRSISPVNNWAATAARKRRHVTSLPSHAHVIKKPRWDGRPVNERWASTQVLRQVQPSNHRKEPTNLTPEKRCPNYAPAQRKFRQKKKKKHGDDTKHVYYVYDSDIDNHCFKVLYCIYIVGGQ